MDSMPKEQFLDEYSKALADGNAALFAGAGTSVDSGMVDWSNLLRGIAKGLHLEIDEETDLIALAQYEFNNSGTRHRLNSAIIDEFKKRASPSANHKWIAQLPLSIVWTTNYDSLIEKAFEEVDKRVDPKWDSGQLTHRVRDVDVTIYKMHGDVSDPNRAVLTKDDYERYDIERSAFTELLRTDLTRNCFLFLGFSFTDPNIEYILSRLRQMLDGAQRIHYCIMRKPPKPSDPAEADKHSRDLARFRHRITDLKRFGIQTVVIENFREIEPILKELVRRAAAQNVLISGSAHDGGSFGKERLESLARQIGKELVARGYNLVSGYGLGVGGACILGAHEAAYFTRNSRPGQRLLLRVFPQDIPSNEERKALYTRIRTEMAQQSGATIFLAGNKFDKSTNGVVLADGVMQEFELAREQGHVLIPVPCTGYAAKQIWQEMERDLPSFFGKADVKAEFAILNDATKSEAELVEAIFNILEKNKKE